MPNRSRIRRDLNQNAFDLVARVTGEAPDPAEPVPDVEPGAPTKDPAAVALGRRGGLKGGKARAAKLSPEERSEAARKAAACRWTRRS